MRDMGSGKYYYFGFSNKIILALEKDPPLKFYPILEFHMNTNGLPLFKSGGFQLWPTLIRFTNSKLEPLMVGCYAGKGKPPSSEEYLRPFIDEFKTLLQEGFTHEGSHYTIRLKCIVCDAPARAFIKKHKVTLWVFLL